MDHRDVLVDAFGRVDESLARVLDGLGADALSYRADPDANTIAWLLWHLTRVQDDHVAGVAGTDQVWTADGWCDRFGLPFAPEETGYGQSSDEVAQVRVGDAALLREYHRAVHERTVAFLRGVDAADLDRVVDRRWDPPVTLGVRLVSVVDDCLEHVGQAAYVRGLAERS